MGNLQPLNMDLANLRNVWLCGREGKPSHGQTMMPSGFSFSSQSGLLLTISLDLKKLRTITLTLVKPLSVSWLNYFLLCHFALLKFIPHWPELKWALKNTQPCLKSFNSHPLHLLGKISFQGTQDLSPCLSSLHSSTRSLGLGHHRTPPKAHYLLSPWLWACCSLRFGLPHSLIYPANTIHSFFFPLYKMYHLELFCSQKYIKR